MSGCTATVLFNTVSRVCSKQLTASFCGFCQALGSSGATIQYYCFFISDIHHLNHTTLFNNTVVSNFIAMAT